jgi:VanZ family protein
VTPSPRRSLHVAAFVVPLGVFTYLLLTPEPPKPPTQQDWLVFLFYKSAHVSGYAYLAAVGYLLPRLPRHRWAVVGFMMAHGVLTETIQALVPELHRHGCIQDVLIDWSGVAVGVALARWITPPRREEKLAPPAFAGSQFPAARAE